MGEALAVLIRWLHISSVATLIGGALYARYAALAAAGTLDPEARNALSEAMAARFKPLALAAVAALTISGIYNLAFNPGHTLLYHILLGVKLLLVLHVFAVVLLSVQPNNQKRGRLMAGAAISGLVIIAISAYLRRIF